MSRLDNVYQWFDSRFGLGKAQSFLGKAFPAEDSFLLGEVALFCFGLLVASGTFLGFFYEPSTAATQYQGSVMQYQGEEMPAAFVSVLQITYDVPFGMLIRRMHHWAAHLFIASMALHMLRVFFTGAYRNPREPNWLVGLGLAGLSMGAAYTGYSLPFDEFASTAVGIGYNVTLSIPLFGEWLSNVAFGGSFPSSSTIPRLYFFHVVVIPLAIAGLLAVHMAILIRQKHTEAAREEDVQGRGTVDADDVQGRETVDVDDGQGRETVDSDDGTVIVGLPAVPNQVAVSAVVFFLTLATLSLLSGFFPVHNIAAYGPNNPASTPELIMPDWFLMWGYGFLKLTPSWLSFDLFGVHFSAEFIGGLVLPGIVFAVVAAWPFIDYSKQEVHFTADPTERPWPTAVGMAGVTFIMAASIAGMDVVLGEVVGMSTAALRPYLIGLVIGAPILIGLASYAALGGFETDPPTEGTATTDGGEPKLEDDQ